HRNDECRARIDQEVGLTGYSRRSRGTSSRNITVTLQEPRLPSARDDSYENGRCHFTLIFFRRYVGTSRSSPSTIVGSLFSKRPRLTGSNCKTSCLACIDFSGDPFSSFGWAGFLSGVLKGGSGVSTTSKVSGTDSTG